MVKDFTDHACVQKEWIHFQGRQLLQLFCPLVCVEVLQQGQPNGVMSSTLSLPNHTFTGQAQSSKRLTIIVHVLCQKLTTALFESVEGNDHKKHFMIKSSQKNAADPAGVEPPTYWSSAGPASNSTNNVGLAPLWTEGLLLMVRICSTPSGSKSRSLFRRAFYAGMQNRKSQKWSPVWKGQKIYQVHPAPLKVKTRIWSL